MLVKAEYGKNSLNIKKKSKPLAKTAYLQPYTFSSSFFKKVDMLLSSFVIDLEELKIRGNQQKKWCLNAFEKEQSLKFPQCCKNYIANFSPPTLYYSVWYNHILHTVVNQKLLKAIHKHLVRPYERNNSFPSSQTKKTHRQGPDPRQYHVSTRTCVSIPQLLCCPALTWVFFLVSLRAL